MNKFITSAGIVTSLIAVAGTTQGPKSGSANAKLGTCTAAKLIGVETLRVSKWMPVSIAFNQELYSKLDGARLAEAVRSKGIYSPEQNASHPVTEYFHADGTYVRSARAEDSGTYTFDCGLLVTVLDGRIRRRAFYGSSNGNVLSAERGPGGELWLGIKKTFPAPR